MPTPLPDDLSPLYQQLQDRFDAGRWEENLATSRKPAVVQGPDDITLLALDSAERHGVDPRLVSAVIGIESGGNPLAMSPKGAQGVMQLMPGTAKRFGVTDMRDPAQNIEGGVRYLAWLRDQFPGRPDLQLAAYHAGEGAVRNAGMAIPDTHDGNMTTSQYVNTVLARYQGGDVYQSKRAQHEQRGEALGMLPPREERLEDPEQAARRAALGTPLPLAGQTALPSVEAVTQKLAEPESLMYLPEERTLAEREEKLGLAPRTTGGGTAAPFRPFGEAGVEEAEPSRTFGFLGEAAITGVRQFLQFAPTLSEFFQGKNQPGVVAGLATMAAELGEILRPIAQSVKPTILGDPNLWDQVAQGFGSAASSLVLGALSGGGLVGAGVAGFTEASQEAQALKENLLPLVGEEEATRRAMQSFGLNLGLVTLTDKLGIFGGQQQQLRQVLTSIVMNDVQEAVQYDIERRQMWVPTTDKNAEALLATGWTRSGDRVVKPFVPRDLGEVLAVATVVGGGLGAAVGVVGAQNIPELQAFVAQETALGHPDVTVRDVVEAANNPETPREGVEPATWKRWATWLYDTILPPGQGGGMGLLGGQRGSTGGGQIPLPTPTVRAGAEGLTPERYRTESGRWRIPLKDMPSQELELQDFVWQQGGIKLAGESDVPGELRARIAAAEVGSDISLQNNASGLTLQQMAERAEQHGFISTPDKEAMLDALDRSVVRGQATFSRDATGYVPLIDNPHVQAGYQSVLDAVETMRGRTEEQVAGVRRRQVVHEEARELIASGQWSLDDVREIFPNTTLNDTMASALLQSLNTIGERMAVAAQEYLDGGERLGSREEASLQALMAMLAELDPVRLGVSAAQSRGLGILNDPLSGYTQYLNNLHRVLETAPQHTMGNIARRILASRPEVALSKATLAANPALLADLFAEHYAMVERFKTAEPISPLEPGVQQPLFPRQAEFQPVDWQAISADIARINALPKIDPLRTPMQDELFSKLLGRQWDEAGSQQLAAFLAARADADTLRRFSETLRPWTAERTQLELPLLRSLVQTTKPGFQDYFLELWFNAMLSNPATHIANAISNTVVSAWAIPERFIAEQFSHGQEGGVARGEATAMLYGLVHGIHDAWAGAKRSWETGRPVSGFGRETTREPVWTASNVGLDPTSGLGRVMDFFFEYIGASALVGSPSLGRLPSKALMASDEFFKMLNYRMELNALAYRSATREGYEGPAWAEHVARIVSNPNLGELQQAARDFGVIQTFQKELQPRTVGGALQAVANIEARIKWTDQTFPVGRVLVPFVQTPANIARYAMERTPLGYFFQSYTDDMAAGGARADLAHAKITLGSLTMLAAAGLALSGRLVGRGPEDPDLRAIWLESHPEYSVRFPGGTWVSLDRFEPAGMFFGMTADIVQIQGEASATPLQKALVAPMYGFLRNITSKTYFSSLSSFFDAMAPRVGVKEQQFEERFFRWTSRLGASLAQPSALMAATARVTDPAEKEARDLIDAMYARVPGWRRDVPSRRTLGGDKVIYGWGFDPEVLANTVRAYSPMKLGDGLVYPADREILDNKMGVNRPPRSLMTQALPPGTQAQAMTEMDTSELKTLRLTDRQYEKYAVLAGGNQVEAEKLGLQLPTASLQAIAAGLSSQFAATAPGNVLGLDAYLDWAIKQPEYRAASPGPGGGKEAIFQQALRQYRQLGLQLLLAQEPELQAQYDQSKIQQLMQRVPLGERPGVQQQLQEGMREGREQIREELGLRPGVGGGSRGRPREGTLPGGGTR